MIVELRTVTIGGKTYQLGAMRDQSGGYLAALKPEGWDRWQTDGAPHTTPAAAIEAAARAAEVDRIARG